MIGILGGGLGGLSAAYHLQGLEYRILEAENWVGGLCRSDNINGFIFDRGPHILYTSDKYAESLIKKLLKSNLLEKKRLAYVFLNKVYVKYPFEANLSPLPKWVIEECIIGALRRGHRNPKNFNEWIYETFGSGIAKHYMIPYNEKLWKYDLNKMSIDWVYNRVPTPSIEDMIRGGLGTQKKEFGPNAIFWYSKKGGIDALQDSLARDLKGISTNSSVEFIKFRGDHCEVKVRSEKDRKIFKFDFLINTIPLPELENIIDDIPSDISRSLRSLEYNTLCCIRLAVNRRRISSRHWLYFPEKKYNFHRISFPTNFSKYTGPDNKSSILVEITKPRGTVIDEDAECDIAIDGLIDTGILIKTDEILVKDVFTSDYAYVINDLDCKKNVKTIHSFLREHRIAVAGRFGEWGYLNMDASILSGKRAAEEIYHMKVRS